MAFNDDLQKEVGAVLRAVWNRRDGTVVPADDSLRLGNDAVELDATVLFADLADSTNWSTAISPHSRMANALIQAISEINPLLSPAATTHQRRGLSSSTARSSRAMRPGCPLPVDHPPPQWNILSLKA